MSKLENFIITYYFYLDESEKLSERQKRRLEALKHKCKEINEESEKINKYEHRKRCPDVNGQDQVAETK